MIFEQIGDKSKELNAGESVSYEWFIYNGYNYSILIQVSANITSGPEWSSSFDRTIAVLNPGDSLFVNLTVSATGDVDERNINQSVRFLITDLTTSLNILKLSYAQTKMIPIWGALSADKNKILWQFENPLPAPLNNNYGTFALNLLIWAGIALIFAYVIGPAARMFTKRTKTDLDDRIIKILHVPIFVLIIVFGLVTSLSILPLSEHEVRIVFESYGIVLIAILTFVIYKVFKEVIIYVGKRWAARTKTEIDDVLIPVLDKVGGLIILVFGAIAVVNYLGYNITFLLAGVGVFGLVIAFAAQDALSNFFSGMALLLDRPFVEGDYVQLASGEMCRVEKIGIRSCRLYDIFNNNHIVLPNNKLVNDKVTNLSEPDEQGIIELVVNVAQGSDVPKVEKIMSEIANANPEIIKEEGKEPAVRLSNFGESSLEFKLFAWVGNFMVKWRVAHELRKEISRRFAEEGVEIAVPGRKVIIKEDKRSS